MITTYNLLRLDFDAYKKRSWSGLFLDEAQAVKNLQSDIYHRVRQLHSPVKIAITGTPLENNTMELWSLLSITAPGLFPRPDRFFSQYARPIEDDGDHERVARLQRLITPLVMRRTKDQAAADLFFFQYARPIEDDGDHERVARLQRLITPLVMRRTKDQAAAEFQAKHEHVLARVS